MALTRFAPQRIALAADESSAEGAWQLLLPVGVKHRADFGKLEMSKTFLSKMAANFQAENVRRPVNYFHRGASNVAAPIDDKIAAGWITGAEYRDAPVAGLYVRIKYTDKARGHIVADEIAYLSAEFDIDRMSKSTGKMQGPTLTGAGLLNDPFINEAVAIAAAETGVNLNPEFLKSLGLSEDATDADVLAAIAKLTAVGVQLTEGSTKLAETEVKLAETEAQAVKLAAEVASLKLSARTAEVKSFVDGLVKALKVTPAARAEVEKLGLANGVESIKFFELMSPAGSTVEVGVTGTPGATDPKKDAAARFNARCAELESKGMAFMNAHAQTKAELSADFALAFSAK